MENVSKLAGVNEMFPALVATRENNSYRLSVFNFAGLLILPVNIGLIGNRDLARISNGVRPDLRTVNSYSQLTWIRKNLS